MVEFYDERSSVAPLRLTDPERYPRERYVVVALVDMRSAADLVEMVLGGLINGHVGVAVRIAALRRSFSGAQLQRSYQIVFNGMSVASIPRPMMLDMTDPLPQPNGRFRWVQAIDGRDLPAPQRRPA